MARLGDYVTIRTGKLDANAASEEGQYPFFTCAVTPLKIDYYAYDCECVLVAGNGDLNVKYYSGKFNAYQRTYIIESRNKEILSVEYLYYFLDNYVETLREQAIGGVIKYIKLENLTEAPIPIPSIQAQEHAVQILHKSESLIKSAQKRVSLMDELIKSRFLEMFGDITETVSLSHYIKGLVAGKSLAGEEDCSNKVLKTGAVTYDYFDETQVKNLPKEYLPPTEHQVKAGDVIISRMNTTELVGAAGYVWSEPIKTYLPDRLWRAELQPSTNPIFVWQLLIHPSTKDAIRSIASGTSGSMKNISKKELLKLQVKAVSFARQNQFATFVTQTNKSKLSIQQSLEKSKTLKKSLMQQYFR